MKEFVIFLLSVFTTTGSRGAVPPCPNECTCEVAPLRSAPFVITWMTSWGEQDIPDFHPNDVLDSGPMVDPGTAEDAKVDMGLMGLHSTCSLHTTTNLTQLFSSLPESVMVLTLLQAPGCNFTIIDGSHLARLSSLRAFHIQGFGQIKKRQVSGFPSGTSNAYIRGDKSFHSNHYDHLDNDLYIALVEDALRPLKTLELLDLQYTRLVASEEAKRLRRYSKEPISSTVILDMPIKQFIRIASKFESFSLPTYLQDKYNISYTSKEADKVHPSNDNAASSSREINKIPLFQTISELNKKSGFVPKGKSSYVVPYSVYKSQSRTKLEPFRNLNQLKYLRIAHAHLDRIGSEFLNGLQNLHTLTLEHNKIKVIPKGFFAYTPNLRHLSVAYNNLLMINGEVLNPLSKLQTLDLDHNELSYIGPSSLSGLSSLKILRVYENPVTNILPGAFISLNNTEKLYLGSLGISMSIHENSFKFLSNVKEIVIRNVSLPSLQKTLLVGLSGIEHFSVHGNVSEIDYDAFSTTTKLLSLNISRCFLEFLSVDALYGLKRLQVLDLSHNSLTSLSPGTFDYLDSLEELYIHNNLLSSLPLGIFLQIPVKLIQLHENPWHCTCDLLQLKPSITNMIRKLKYMECVWDDKLNAICKESKSKFTYDARVAPLCQTPFQYTGSDVYHTALRHLKCSKHHWDPSILLSDSGASLNDEQKSSTLSLPESSLQFDIQRHSWLPLTAYTPAPVDVEDLLDLAEREGLEEAFDEQIEGRQNQPALEGTFWLPNYQKRPINDDPQHKLDSSENILAKKNMSYKEKKAKIKAMMKAQETKRLQEKMLKLKLLLEKEKELIKNEFRKHKDDKKDLVVDLPNHLNPNYLKTNYLF